METLVHNEARIHTASFSRFGACSFSDEEVLSFPWGLPGFPELRRFVALQVADQDRFVWLQSLDNEKVAIPMVDPWSIYDDYEPRLPQYAQSALDIRTAEEFAVYAVVVVTGQAHEMTVNLLAPVVINLRTRIGRQVPLENQAYAIRTPVPRKGAGEALAS